MKRIDKLLVPNYKKIKVLRILDEYDLKKINKNYNLSLMFILKRYVKDSLFFFLKNIPLINKIFFIRSRTLLSVKFKYDNMAGVYVDNQKNFKNEKYLALNEKNEVLECRGIITPYYADCLKGLFLLSKSKSLLEVGAGELTTISLVLNSLKKKFSYSGAIDISLNRLLVGKKYLKSQGNKVDFLARADASQLPFKDNSFDMVYTCHCLEQVPNLFIKSVKELIRVSKKYIVIIEPSYEFSLIASKNNIYKKGYTKITDALLSKTGFTPIYRKFLPLKNYISSAEIIVFEKKNYYKSLNKKDIQFVSPISREKLSKNKKFLLDKKNFKKYKIYKKIPLLAQFDAENC